MVRNYLIFSSNLLNGQSVLINCDYPGQFISQIYKWLAGEFLGIDESAALNREWKFSNEEWKKFVDCSNHVICCSFYLLEGKSQDIWAESINTRLKENGLDYSVQVLRGDW